MSEHIQLTVAEATRLGEDALLANGFDAEQAQAITAHLVDAMLCGLPFAGLPRILTILEDPRTHLPRSPLKVVHETKLSAMIDGGNNVGYYAVMKATELAIEKARGHGIAVVGMYRSHLNGRSAYYMDRIARAGFVGIHTTSGPAIVLPHGGRQPAFGTNPVAFGFPMEPDPFIVDFGTAAMMRGDVILHKRTGKPLPEGVALDAAGQPTTEASAVLDGGGVFTFGGHRSSALSFGIQALGLLAGGARPRGVGKDFSFLFVVFDPELLMPAAEFREHLGELIGMVRAIPPRDPAEPVRIPSERAYRERRERMAQGVPLHRSIHEQLKKLGERKG